MDTYQIYEAILEKKIYAYKALLKWSKIRTKKNCQTHIFNDISR